MCLLDVREGDGGMGAEKGKGGEVKGRSLVGSGGLPMVTGCVWLCV